MSETVQAVRLFEDITKRYAEQVKAEELLPIIEDATVERMEMQARIDGSHLRLGRAEDLIWREHYVLAHWFVQPIWHMLRCEDRNAARLPPVINEFCKAFGNPVWLSRMLTGHLSTSAEDIDLRVLCRESAERISRMFRTELSLTIASEITPIATTNTFCGKHSTLCSAGCIRRFEQPRTSYRRARVSPPPQIRNFS